MRRYGLIGRPLGHSFSARYFAEKFRREEIADCRYDLFELPEIDRLPELLAACPELCGFNVTIPYKRSVFDFLQEVSDEARRIGADCYVPDAMASVRYAERVERALP